MREKGKGEREKEGVGEGWKKGNKGEVGRGIMCLYVNLKRRLHETSSPNLTYH